MAPGVLAVSVLADGGAHVGSVALAGVAGGDDVGAVIGVLPHVVGDGVVLHGVGGVVVGLGRKLGRVIAVLADVGGRVGGGHVTVGLRGEFGSVLAVLTDVGGDGPRSAGRRTRRS